MVKGDKCFVPNQVFEPKKFQGELSCFLHLGLEHAVTRSSTRCFDEHLMIQNHS